MTDRQSRYEARRRESGWRMISVRLDAETLAALERLAERYGGDRSAAIRAAIKDKDEIRVAQAIARRMPS